MVFDPEMLRARCEDDLAFERLQGEYADCCLG
jgi:hypothetical protein